MLRSFWLVISLFVLVAGSNLDAAEANLALPGPFAVGYLKTPVTRDDGTTFNVTICYPAERYGRNQPVDRTAGPYCPIIFDSVVLPPAYRSTLIHLASWGFVVLMPNFALEHFPDTEGIADDIGICLNYLIAESSRSGSPFYGAIRGDRCGFGGHSLGSGCGIIQGTKEGSRLKVIANMACGNRTTPPTDVAVKDLRVPLIMLAGSSDRIATLSTQLGPIYNAAPSPKGLFVLQGASHMQFTDSILVKGGSPDLMPPEEQLAISHHYLTAAFLLYLQEDDSRWPLLWDPQLSVLPDVQPTLQSGIVWETPAAALTGTAGDLVELSATVTNESPMHQGFEFFTDSNGWTAEVTPTVIGDLPPMGSAQATIRVTIPERTALLGDVVRLSARSTRDGHTRGVKRLTVTRTAAPDQIRSAKSR